MSDMLEMFPSCCTSLTSLNVCGFSHGGIRAAEGALSTGSGIGWSCDYRLRLSHRSVPRCPVPSTWCWVRDRTCRQTWLMSTHTHTHRLGNTECAYHQVKRDERCCSSSEKKKKKGSKMTFCYEGWYDTSLLLRKLISGMNRKTDNTFLLEQSGTSGNIYFILLEKESATTFNLQSQSERHGGGKKTRICFLFQFIYL